MERPVLKVRLLTIVVSDELITTFTRLGQAPNAFEPTVVTEAGIVIDVNPELLNAYEPMDVTEFGIVTDPNEVHPLNTPSPMVVTEFGIVTDVNMLQLANAFVLMIVTESGIITDVIAALLMKAIAAMLVTLYVAPFTTKLDNKVMLPDADPLDPTLAATVPTV